MAILCPLLKLYLFALFGRIILSWFPISPGSALASVYRFLYTITEPVLGPVRRVIPPIGGGGMAFDKEGNLYVGSGDNNSSGGSDGYSGNNWTAAGANWSASARSSRPA